MRFILGGIAFSARRRRFLSRLVLLGLVALVSVLGTVACSPLYNYHNHGPPHNLPTPAGSYNVTIAAQSSNGVTATNPHNDHCPDRHAVARNRADA